MKSKISNLKKEILLKNNFETPEVFAGANLIITENKNREHKPQDVLVISNNARELSWLVYKLKDIFKDEIDSANKYAFYTHIGHLMNEAIKNDLELKEQMLFVLDNLGKFTK